MWNKSIALPKAKKVIQDEEGFKKEEYEMMRKIPANFTYTTRNDELLASQKGYTADQNIEIVACNYDGQTWLCDEETGEIYDVKRTYRKDKSMHILLTCERRITGGL